MTNDNQLAKLICCWFCFLTNLRSEPIELGVMPEIREADPMDAGRTRASFSSMDNVSEV